MDFGPTMWECEGLVSMHPKSDTTMHISNCGNVNILDILQQSNQKEDDPILTLSSSPMPLM
jgi:hypothetical protein